MAISFVGSASAAATSVTLPAHQAGDLILIFAYRGNSMSAPSVPAGYTQFAASGSLGNAAVVGYKIAASNAETSGAWTNAQQVIAHVYRGVSSGSPLGGSARNITSGASADYPSLSMTKTDGTSWVAGFIGAQATNSAIETAPAGMTNRSDQVGSGEAAGHDTNGGVSSWSSTSVSTGGTVSSKYATVVEILADTTIHGAAALTEADDSVGGAGIHLPNGSLTITETDDVVSALGSIKGGGFVGAASASGATSVALPSHQAGDLILVFAYRKGSATPPSLPAGYTSIRAQQESGGGSSFRLGYKIAASGAETSGTWTNATGIVAQVYRGEAANPIGGNSYADGATASVIYPGVTMAITNGTSWVATFAGIATNASTIDTAPGGQVQRTSQADVTNGEVAGFDTAGAVSSWSNQTIGVGSAASWLTVSVEIIADLKGQGAAAEGNDALAATAIGPNGAATIAEAGDTLAAAGAASLKATLAATEANDTVTSAGGIIIKATLAAPEANDSVTATAAVKLSGTGAITEGDDTGSLAAALAIKGTASIGEADDSLSAASDLAGGVAAAAEDDDVLSGIAGLRIAGTLTATEAGDLVAAAGSVKIAGTAGMTEVGDTLTGTGAISARGSLAASEADDAPSAMGKLSISAGLALIEASDSGSSGGILPLHGILSASEAGDAVSGAGTLPLHGSLAATEAGDSVSAFGGASLTGHLTVTEEDDSTSAAGTLPLHGSLTITEARDTLSAAGANTTSGRLTIIEANDTLSGSVKISIEGALSVSEADDNATSDSFTSGFKVLRFDGATWTLKPLKRWSGAAWVPVPRSIVRRYIGGDPADLANWPLLYP